MTAHQWRRRGGGTHWRFDDDHFLLRATDQDGELVDERVIPVSLLS
jgi:hypothetical protein